jgi:hypothetical protein
MIIIFHFITHLNNNLHIFESCLIVFHITVFLITSTPARRNENDF